MLEKQYRKSLERRYKTYNDAIEYIGKLESIISNLQYNLKRQKYGHR